MSYKSECIKTIEECWEVIDDLNKKLKEKEREILDTLSLEELREWIMDLEIEINQIEESLNQFRKESKTEGDTV